MTTKAGATARFGFWPAAEIVDAGPVHIEPLADLVQLVAQVRADPAVEKGWIFAPRLHSHELPSGRVTEKPYGSRVFGLHPTHAIRHDFGTVADLDFHIWGLSFFTGMRLTTTEAGFLDATPVEPGKLVDFVLLHDLSKAVVLVEAFKVAHATSPRRIRLVAAAIHALFLAQGPQLLEFERFTYCYTALDACYALASDISPPARRPNHATRAEWLCNQFAIPVPSWAQPNGNRSAVADIRNPMVHEALYMDEPLGFALHGVGAGQNLPLYMEALVCRILVALLGAPQAEYVRTATDTHQRHGLDLT